MRILTFLLLLTGTCCFGQNSQLINIASNVSTERLKKNLYYLASEQLEGRAMGSRGDTLASEYVAKCFKENRLKAPYENNTSYYQAINAYRKNLLQSELVIGNRKYDNWNGWGYALRSMETVQLNNIPVVFAGYGIEHSRYNDFANIDVKGKIVLLLTGQPQDSMGVYLLTGTKQPAVLPAYQNLLKEKGAVGILMYASRFTADSLAQRKHSSRYTKTNCCPIPIFPWFSCLNTGPTNY